MSCLQHLKFLYEISSCSEFSSKYFVVTLFKHVLDLCKAEKRDAIFDNIRDCMN
jgi:hypothetical protein